MKTTGKRKESRETLEQRLAERDRELFYTTMALQAMVNKDIDATEEAFETTDSAVKSRYTYRLARADAPHGGLLIVTHHHPGQRDATSVYGDAAMVLPAWARDMYAAGQHDMGRALGWLADVQRRLIAERTAKTA